MNTVTYESLPTPPPERVGLKARERNLLTMNTASSDPSTHLTLKDFLEEVRPRQWMKNVVVLAAFFFALGDKQQSVSPGLFWNAILAALLFSITASGVYVFNDILDIDLDRLHPVKSHRPVASGKIRRSSAWILTLACLGTGLLGSWFFSPRLGTVMAAYVGIQAAYTLKLKHVPLIDVFVIAVGFVLRAVAGGVAARVAISSWLLICTFLMALFLALCKRRHERRMIDERQLDESRPSIKSSDVRLFDQLIAVVAGAVIIAYAVYTQWPDTVEKFGTNRLSFTIPFVVFGLFRYLDLVYRQAKGDQPEYILLTDIPLILDIALFGLCMLWITIL